MATNKNNVRDWFKSLRGTIEEKVSGIGKKISNAPNDYVERVINPETEKDQKLAEFDTKISEVLDTINDKYEGIRDKIISNDKLRTIAVAVCEKLIDKANPKKDTPFTLSVSILTKLENSLELRDAKYGETFSDEKLRILGEKLLQHPDFEQKGQDLLDGLEKDNVYELDVSQEEELKSKTQEVDNTPKNEGRKVQILKNAEISFGSGDPTQENEEEQERSM